MEFKEAMDIIEKKETGYRVHFEEVKGGCRHSDYFPEKHEEIITKSEDAWDLAERFSKATDDTFINIYVVDNRHNPVAGYHDRTFKRR